MLVADAGYHCKESVEQGFEPCIAGSRERHDQPPLERTSAVTITPAGPQSLSEDVDRVFVTPAKRRKPAGRLRLHVFRPVSAGPLIANWASVRWVSSLSHGSPDGRAIVRSRRATLLGLCLWPIAHRPLPPRAHTPAAP